MKKLQLWKSVRTLALLYDAGMGMFIFVPVAICSWFPFVSTFQTRLLFNQAFSRGLEISLILAGNNPNSGLWHCSKEKPSRESLSRPRAQHLPISSSSCLTSKIVLIIFCSHNQARLLSWILVDACMVCFTYALDFLSCLISRMMNPWYNFGAWYGMVETSDALWMMEVILSNHPFFLVKIFVLLGKHYGPRGNKSLSWESKSFSSLSSVKAGIQTSSNWESKGFSSVTLIWV